MNPLDLPSRAVMHGPPLPPRMAARRLADATIRGEYTPEALHEYTDQDGRPLYWRIRARLPDGSKVIRPICVRGMEYALREPDFGGKKPVYRLHELVAADPTLPIWWVEGEQKADALASLGLLATTAGSASSDDGCDFAPLRGRRVIVWPDNDDPGKQHAQRVAAKLKAIGCTVEIIDLAPLALAEHGDVVDWLAVHPDATAADLEALARLPAVETTASDTPRVELLRADEVTLEPVRWLWKDWIAAGKLHILAGAPSAGKTTICLSLAATISSGGRWPDGTQAEPGEVLIWSGEDDLADTLAPRLKAAGANLSRIRFVRHVWNAGGIRSFDPARDMSMLLEAARRLPELRLVILDPIVNAVGGDSHKNTEVRRDLQPVVDLAESLRAAVIGISHFSKGTAGRNPVERVTGSLAFGAVARAVLAAAKIKTEDGTDRRVLARAKSNLSPISGGFAYSLEQVGIGDGIEASRVRWGAAVEGSAQELLADAEAESEDGNEHRDATEWLREVLADGVEVEARVMRQLADEAGHKWRTVQRAAKRIGVLMPRQGFGPSCRTIWHLPVAPNDPLAPLAPDSKIGATGATDVPPSHAEVF